MMAIFVILSENIKEKGVNVVVQRLVVQEQLGQVAQVLAVQLMSISINFPKGQLIFAITVNFISWRMPILRLDFGQMVEHFGPSVKKHQVIIAQIQRVDGVRGIVVWKQFLWIRVKQAMDRKTLIDRLNMKTNLVFTVK